MHSSYIIRGISYLDVSGFIITIHLLIIKEFDNILYSWALSPVYYQHIILPGHGNQISLAKFMTMSLVANKSLLSLSVSGDH